MTVNLNDFITYYKLNNLLFSQILDDLFELYGGVDEFNTLLTEEKPFLLGDYKLVSYAEKHLLEILDDIYRSQNYDPDFYIISFLSIQRQFKHLSHREIATGLMCKSNHHHIDVMRTLTLYVMNHVVSTYSDYVSKFKSDIPDIDRFIMYLKDKKSPLDIVTKDVIDLVGGWTTFITNVVNSRNAYAFIDLLNDEDCIKVADNYYEVIMRSIIKKITSQNLNIPSYFVDNPILFNYGYNDLLDSIFIESSPHREQFKKFIVFDTIKNLAVYYKQMIDSNL